MKYAVLIVLVFLIDPGKIGKVNNAKSEAKKAYQAGEYETAVRQYKTLIDSLGVKEDEVSMNLAHSYFHLNDTLNANNAYLPLTNSNNSKIKSVANLQLGVMANRLGKFEEALNYFKNALKADPTNEEARFNYEIVKKKLEEKKKQEEQQQQNKDQKKDDQKKEDEKKDEKKDQKDNKDNKDEKKDDQKKDEKEKKDKDQKDQKSKEQEEKDKQQKEEQQKKEEEQKEKDKKDIPPSVSDKLKEMKMSEDKARMVLEAMKNQEVQYLQQNKRKATKPKTKGKPDW